VIEEEIAARKKSSDKSLEKKQLTFAFIVTSIGIPYILFRKQTT
jgi:hypothetical protein